RERVERGILDAQLKASGVLMGDERAVFAAPAALEVERHGNLVAWFVHVFQLGLDFQVPARIEFRIEQRYVGRALCADYRLRAVKRDLRSLGAVAQEARRAHLIN